MSLTGLTGARTRRERPRATTPGIPLCRVGPAQTLAGIGCPPTHSLFDMQETQRIGTRPSLLVAVRTGARSTVPHLCPMDAPPGFRRTASVRGRLVAECEWCGGVIEAQVRQTLVALARRHALGCRPRGRRLSSGTRPHHEPGTRVCSGCRERHPIETMSERFVGRKRPQRAFYCPGCSAPAAAEGSRICRHCKQPYPVGQMRRRRDGRGVCYWRCAEICTKRRSGALAAR